MDFYELITLEEEAWNLVHEQEDEMYGIRLKAFMMLQKALDAHKAGSSDLNQLMYDALDFVSKEEGKLITGTYGNHLQNTLCGCGVNLASTLGWLKAPVIPVEIEKLCLNQISILHSSLSTLLKEEMIKRRFRA